MSFKGISRRVIALIATAALLTVAVGAGLATAADGRDHGDAHNTFTKWVTGPGTPPVLFNMAGIVGGDVGAGSFTGEVLSFVQPANVATIHAVYHFNGSRHSFTANVVVVQTDLKAVITGFVTDGWLYGNLVQGQYTQITCSHDGTSTACFQGTLDIVQGSKKDD